MEASKGLLVSPEAAKALSIGLLREWWLTATQALVDAAGSETALKHMKPYFVHMGKAGAINISAMTGTAAPSTDVQRKDWPMSPFIQKSAVGGNFGKVFRASDETAITELTECETKGNSKEACICLCSYCMGAGAEENYSKMEYVLLESLSAGDPNCKWLSKWRGRQSLVAPTEEFLTHEFDELPPGFTEELSEYLGLSVAGEAWVLATRAFVDFAGPEEAARKLSFYMRHSGLSVGTRIATEFDLHDADAGTLAKIMMLLNNLHKREGTVTLDGDEVRGSATKCPFSDAPREVCLQYEAFCNGICEAINPAHEFAYTKTMTNGAPECTWAIRKKGQHRVEVVKEEKLKANALKALTMKYAQGEISKKEYDEMRTILEDIDTER